LLEAFQSTKKTIFTQTLNGVVRRCYEIHKLLILYMCLLKNFRK